MITITADTPNLAWYECLRKLCFDCAETDNNKYWRDELVVIEILNPCIENAPYHYPMSQNDLDIINNYIITGENEELVKHEWTKLYFDRIYSEPNNQYNYLLQQLRGEIPTGRAQISLWDKNIDQTSSIAPCTQIIWARIKFGKLEMHVHAHSVNAYNKLLMNQQEFISLQKNIAAKLGIETGKFYHIIDSCHISKEDIASAEAIAKLLVDAF